MEKSSLTLAVAMMLLVFSDMAFETREMETPSLAGRGKEERRGRGGKEERKREGEGSKREEGGGGEGKRRGRRRGRKEGK